MSGQSETRGCTLPEGDNGRCMGGGWGCLGRAAEAWALSVGGEEADYCRAGEEAVYCRAGEGSGYGKVTSRARPEAGWNYWKQRHGGEDSSTRASARNGGGGAITDSGVKSA